MGQEPNSVAYSWQGLEDENFFNVHLALFCRTFILGLMKFSKAIFSILFCTIILMGCFNTADYPKVRDVPTDVKPTLTFEDAKKELAELEADRNRQKAKP